MSNTSVPEPARPGTFTMVMAAVGVLIGAFLAAFFLFGALFVTYPWAMIAIFGALGAAIGSIAEFL